MATAADTRHAAEDIESKQKLEAIIVAETAKKADVVHT
jgi:hypothetical protein